MKSSLDNEKIGTEKYKIYTYLCPLSQERPTLKEVSCSTAVITVLLILNEQLERATVALL